VRGPRLCPVALPASTVFFAAPLHALAVTAAAAAHDAVPVIVVDAHEDAEEQAHADRAAEEPALGAGEEQPVAQQLGQEVDALFKEFMVRSGQTPHA
jgi:hypothetical protein